MSLLSPHEDIKLNNVFDDWFSIFTNNIDKVEAIKTSWKRLVIDQLEMRFIITMFNNIPV